MLFLSLNITYLLALLTSYKTPRQTREETTPSLQSDTSDTPTITTVTTTHLPLILSALTTTSVPKVTHDEISPIPIVLVNTNVCILLF